MKKKLLVLLTLFAFIPFVNAEEYLVVDRDEQSSGVEITQPGEDGSWDLFYDSEAHKFNVVYNITSDAPDEITLDLSYGISLIKEYAQTDEMFTACSNQKEDSCKVTIGKYNGKQIDVNIDLESMKSSISLQGGDKITLNIIVKNNSGKTYFYKEDSLVIASKTIEENDSDIVGFDGQNIPSDSDYTKYTLYVGYNGNLKDHNLVNDLVDKALEYNKSRDKRNFVNSKLVPGYIDKYLKDNYPTSDDPNFDAVDAYFVIAFNEKYNTNYTNIDEIFANDQERIVKEIGTTYSRVLWVYSFEGPYLYDSFYKVYFSAYLDDEESYDAYVEENRGSWGSRDGSTSIEKYMNGKINNVENSRYDNADKKLQEILGKTKDGETKSFNLGINLDGSVNNTFSDYLFGLYSSIKMVAKKGIVIINYVDENGKTLKESETVEYYYYEDYETKAAIIDGYELIEVKGLEKGTIEQDETIVTYIYQFVLGEGGEEFDIVQTGSEVDYSLMSSALITLSLIGLALYTKKKNN